ncbi:MAG: SAM-dependent methyltransferase [Burkholderiales bacterium]|nr:SAM-dependent methyltransferase [Burkholderiales bacterium]
MALYEPGLGYYARGAPIFGARPDGGVGGGSDFVTAPEMSPLFGAALARQVAEVLRLGQLDEVVEFGAGSGALAEQVLQALQAAGVPLRRYAIVELTGALRARQQARLARFGAQVQWLDSWPAEGSEGAGGMGGVGGMGGAGGAGGADEARRAASACGLEAVVIGNEVLDAMPVKLLHWDGREWFERGVVAAMSGGARRLAFGDRPTSLRPPRAEDALPGAVLEVHAQAAAFMATLASRLARGAAFFIDYGFPEREYYHPQRHQGTLMCHRAHRSLPDAGEVLAEPGSKDITAHVDFTAMALAAQDAGAEVVGYTTQARFLVNCGLLDLLRGADARTIAAAQKLITEHEMGELFKVLALARGVPFPAAGPLGFVAGDRTHML